MLRLRPPVACALFGLAIAACADDGSGGHGGQSAGTAAGAGAQGAGGAGGGGAGAMGTSGGGGAGGAASGGGGAGGTGGGPDTTVNCDAPSGTMPPLKLTALTSVNPAASYLVMATTAPGDPDRLFLVSVWGHIYIYNLATQTLNPEPFLNLLGSISFTGERGVLGLAFHPDYQANGRFFVHYSALNTGATQVTEFVRSTPDAAALNPVASVLSEPQPFANHNGGTLTFGPDGLLYLFLGDGGSAGDPFGNGQSLATRLGKVIRLDVDAGGVTAAGGYPGALPEVWAAGLRNPWRAAFDPCTDNLYIADVGQNQWEEVNVVRPTDVGRNFGWDTMEGSQCHEPATGCNTAGLTLPVYEYSHNGSAASITGGYVYRGNNIPAARGRYFFADWSTGMVRSFRFEAGQAMDVLDHGAEIGLNAPGFGQDADGELYVTDGTTLYRIDPDI